MAQEQQSKADSNAKPNVIKAFISGLSAKEKKILYITCAVVFLAIFDRLIVGPLSSESRELEQRISTQTKLIGMNLLILEHKDKIMSEDEAYGLFYTKEGLTHEELIAKFLKEVEGLAKDSQVVLTNINPVELEEKTDYVQYSLTVECTGNMKDVLNFIYGIDSTREPIRVSSYEVTPKKRDTYDVNCTLTIVKVILILESTENEEMDLQDA